MIKNLIKKYYGHHMLGQITYEPNTTHDTPKNGRGEKKERKKERKTAQKLPYE